MAFDSKKFRDSIETFTFDQSRLHMVAADFRYDLKKGLRSPEESSLRLLKSYVDLPTGQESGEYLALDFGGTNVRVLRVRLLGNGKYEVVRKVAKPLVVPGLYDFVGKGSKAADLFDFLAGLIDEAIDGDKTKKYRLGHTFSFPSEQQALCDAKLIVWTKEFATEGVEGQYVNKLLKAALYRQGFDNVEPVALINDTIAVLLAAAYEYGDTYIGSIYATGHNTCYRETFAESAAPPMVLNLESGGFRRLIPGKYDIALDAASEKPGQQRLEKMVSGRYLGELFALALADLLGEEKTYAFTSIDLGAMVADETAGLFEVRRLIKEKTGHDLDEADAACVQELAAAIVIRSARLVTATYVGILWQLAGGGAVKKQHIAIDGSLYEHMPRIKEHMMRAFSELLGEEDSPNIDMMGLADGSGLGAAIAAAMAEKG